MSPAQPVHGPYFVNDEKAAICAPYGVLCMFTEWDDEDKATAQLMAAAPELLEALKGMLALAEALHWPAKASADLKAGEKIAAACAAIAKAEGRS